MTAVLKFRVVSNIGPKLAVSYVEQVSNFSAGIREAFQMFYVLVHEIDTFLLLKRLLP